MGPPKDRLAAMQANAYFDDDDSFNIPVDEEHEGKKGNGHWARLQRYAVDLGGGGLERMLPLVSVMRFYVLLFAKLKLAWPLDKQARSVLLSDSYSMSNRICFSSVIDN